MDGDSSFFSFFAFSSASNEKLSFFFERFKERGSEVVTNSKTAKKNPGMPLK
jgi:hypothetical protein